MKVTQLCGKSAYQTFAQVAKEVYRNNPYYRGTEGSIEKMLLCSKSSFSNHADIKMFVVQDRNDLVARFALIHDKHLPDYVQVSFFEAQEGLGDIFSLIRNEIRTHFPHVKKVVIGLNAHLNYGAGILLNRFDEAPLFGLPYNPPYYSEYFSTLCCRKMVTFRFSMDAYREWARGYSMQRPANGLTVRFMDKRRIESESAIYTQLNNRAFINHPYWANRDEKEDLELFAPFRYFLDNENLIIAEVDGKPVGFYLWYPDFNQLVKNKSDLNAWHLLKYRAGIGKPIDTFRFTEIGILPKYQRTSVAYALIDKSLQTVTRQGFSFCEGGFIFEENRASIAFVKRILKRCYGKEPEPYREFAVFETSL